MREACRFPPPDCPPTVALPCAASIAVETPETASHHRALHEKGGPQAAFSRCYASAHLPAGRAAVAGMATA